MAKTWMITGVSSGFGREMTEQLLSAGDRVIGTVRSTAKVADLIKKYPDTFDCVILDVTDAAKVTETVNEAAAKHGRIDVYVSNAGYGLFGAAEELSLEEIDRILNTNLRGSIAFIRAAIPHLRRAADESFRYRPTADRSPTPEILSTTPPSSALKVSVNPLLRRSRPSGLTLPSSNRAERARNSVTVRPASPN